MSQIYKVFFNNISFEIKPFSNIESKECCIVFFESFDDFLSRMHNTISSQSKNTQGRFILKSYNVRSDWFKLIKNFHVIVAAGGVVRNQKNEYLFIFKNGIWDLPKGKVDADEELHVAAKREICEECGFVDLEICSLLNQTYHIYYEKNVIKLKETNWFLCKSKQTKNLKPQLEEGITKLKWVPNNKLPVILDNSYNSIKELMSF